MIKQFYHMAKSWMVIYGEGVPKIAVLQVSLWYLLVQGGWVVWYFDVYRKVIMM